MDYTRLGHSGLQVSRLCLGCMSFGGGQSGAYDWTLEEADSRPIIRRALEAGINFFDTANGYSKGRSEEITGRALRDFARRDEVVLATKASMRTTAIPGFSDVDHHEAAKNIELDPQATSIESPEFKARLAAAQKR